MRPSTTTQRPLSSLAALLGAAPETTSTHGAVSGITHDSRQVRSGDLYAALPGSRAHGADFAQQAAAAGAVAILTDAAGLERAAATGLPVFVADDVRQWLGEAAAWVYGEPARDIMLLGVTGTSGKTTTAYLLESGLRAADHSIGLVGTVETRIGDEVMNAGLTTPEATDLQALFASMRDCGVTATAMEVSSHALALHRVAATRFDVAVFTNLSQDHLDFHATLPEYFAAKARLFRSSYSDVGVVNIDDTYGQTLTEIADIPITTFSAAGSVAADWQAHGVRHGVDGSAFEVIGPGGVQADVALAIPGAFNVTNALAAIVALVEAGIPLYTAVAGVGELTGVPGRMERVDAGQDFLALVDYAHKPQAVEKLLASLREISTGRLIVVLGCGGDRDREKRPLMGAAAAAAADIAIFTNDNPRSEDPLTILAAMMDGALDVARTRRARVTLEPDRATAISSAVSRAEPGDVVVVAGKGHEQGQEMAGETHPFDDRLALRSAIEAALPAVRRGEAANGDQCSGAASERSTNVNVDLPAGGSA